MKKIIAVLLVLALASLAFTACGTAESPRTVEDFNFDWTFTLGDSPDFDFTSEELAAYEAEQDAAWAVQRQALIDQQKKQIQQRQQMMRKSSALVIAT